MLWSRWLHPEYQSGADWLTGFVHQVSHSTLVMKIQNRVPRRKIPYPAGARLSTDLITSEPVTINAINMLSMPYHPTGSSALLSWIIVKTIDGDARPPSTCARSCGKARSRQVDHIHDAPSKLLHWTKCDEVQKKSCDGQVVGCTMLHISPSTYPQRDGPPRHKRWEYRS